MKLTIICLLILFAISLNGQVAASAFNENYYWSDSTCNMRLELYENKNFEFFADSYFDCTPAFLYYGKGIYEFEKDSIHFHFDSIPQEKSDCLIKSLLNRDEISHIRIKVFDPNGKRVDSLTLRWGKPKKEGNITYAEFFSRTFDEKVELQLQKNEKVNFVRIEKKGFFWANIELPQGLDQDYQIDVTLRPKPQVDSAQYMQGGSVKLPILSDCEILSFDGTSILKREGCH